MDDSLNTPEFQDALSLLTQWAAASGLTLPSLPGAAGSASSATGVAPHADAPARATTWEPYLRYRSLVEKLPVVTFMIGIDADLQEMYVSPQIESLLGFTQEEWLADPILWYKQLHPDDRENWVSEFARTCAMGSHFRAEYRLIARDGRAVWVQGDCQVIRDEVDGRPLFLQGIAFDITHLKRAREIEEDKLAAEAASRAKSEFLARMSHEIRTPLNGVVGMIDLLRATGMTDVQQRYAQLARDAADALMGVINDILDFSKIEAGKVEVESIEFDLHKVVEDLTELLAPVAAKKDLALACCLRSDVPRRLTGDPNRIRQVLTNLVSNALKFTQRGYVSIRAALERVEADRAMVRVQVEDTGIGIPADRLDRLFKSFSQVDTSTTRKFGGTGLGLAISKRLVELMGGEIGIESVEGHGTTFWFTLNVGVVAGADGAAPDGLAEALAAVRVLGVEPEPRCRQILSDQLRGRAAATSAVLGCDTAFSALRRAAAEGKPFDVALVPYGTPDGDRLVADVRSEPSLKRTKLIAVTNVDDGIDAAALTAAGYVVQLNRPLTQSRLADVIAAATIQVTASDAQPQGAPGAAPQTLAGLHVLVAEDNEMNQFVTKETLARAGCTCEIVGDGLLAVEAVARSTYDAVLMDCQMPGMDGLEASRTIREREMKAPGSRHVPIIALTAEAIQGDRERCLAAGMDGYVTKPINPKELFNAITVVVAASRAEQGARTASPATESTEAAVAPAPTAAAPTSPAADVPLDFDALLGRCMRDADFAVRTLEKFGRRAVDDVSRIRGTVAAGDVAATTRLAHNLKAVAAHVSASALSRLAFEIEQAGIRSDLAMAEAQLARLDEEARRCAAFVPSAIQNIRRSPQAVTMTSTNTTTTAAGDEKQ